MLLASLLLRIAKCGIPALIGSATVTPCSTVVDIALVDSITSGSMRRSLVSTAKEYRFDDKSALTLACTFSTLLSTNWFVDERTKILAGVVVSTGLGAWKDHVILGGGSIPATTRVLLVVKDILSTLPSVYRPGMCFLLKTLMVFLFQVPCTLINTIAMEIHVFGGIRGVKRSFYPSFLARSLKSIFGGTLACQVNHAILRRW